MGLTLPPLVFCGEDATFISRQPIRHVVHEGPDLNFHAQRIAKDRIRYFVGFLA